MRVAKSNKAAGLGGDWPVALAMAAALLAVYALTSPRTATLEDDGLFIIAALHAGVAHPPGYPLYTLIGHVFSYLPIDPPALRIHLASGFLGALACVVFYFALRLTRLPIWLSLAAALAYGLSEHFWSQAIIAEVYTLNALLCFGVLYFCLRAREPGRLWNRELALAWAALCFGLGLTNHWPLTVAAFPAFAALLLPHAGLVFLRLPILAAIALAPPLLLYGWMWWRSLDPDAISFYGPLSNWDELWYYLTRQGYGGVDVSPSAGALDRLLFIWHFLKEAFFQYTPLGALLALLGIYRLHLARAHALLAASGWIFVAHSFLLILMLGFDYEFLNLAVFRPYPLVAYGVLAFWVAWGLVFVWEKASARLPGAWAYAPAPPSAPPARSGRRGRGEAQPAAAAEPLLATLGKTLPGALALLLPALLLAINYPINNRKDDTTALEYAEALLAGLEPNAALFVTGDLPTAPVGYLHYGEGVRPDVEVLNTQGLVYPTRLFSPPTTKKNETRLTREYLQKAERPVYYTTNIIDFPNDWHSIHYGLVRKVQKEGPELQLRFDQRTEDYFYRLVAQTEWTDRWNRHLHDRLMQQFGEYIGYMVLSTVPDPSWTARRDRMVAAIQEQYFGLIGMAEMLIKYGTAEHLPRVQAWLGKAETLVGHTMSKEMLGRHYYRRGYLAFRQGRLRQAWELFQHSLKVHPHPDNPSTPALQMLRQDNGKSRR